MSEREDTVKGEHPLSSPSSAPSSLGNFKESPNFKNLSAAHDDNVAVMSFAHYANCELNFKQPKWHLSKRVKEFLFINEK